MGQGGAGIESGDQGWTATRAGGISPFMPAAAALAALFLAAPMHAGEVTRVVPGASGVTIDFDGPVDGASLLMLEAPTRIALDIHGGTAGRQAGAHGGGGAVRAVRAAQFAPDTARLVLDLETPVTVSDVRFSSDGRSLTLSLSPAAADGFKAAARRGRIPVASPAGMGSHRAKKGYSVAVKLDRPRPAANLPRIAGPADPSRPLVVIDAGHGGHDPGAINPKNGAREKDVTLAIARAVRDELVREGRVRVALTRDSDRFVVLQDRYQIARKLGADLFISIHADAAENQDARGATVYTLSEVASDREAARLAARENRANLLNGVDLGATRADVSSILIDLTQRETMNVSADFANALLREAKDDMRLRSQSHRFASFVVLKAPDTPSVLFETGYISNEADTDFLTSRAGQRTVARNLAAAIRLHFARATVSR